MQMMVVNCYSCSSTLHIGYFVFFLYGGVNDKFLKLLVCSIEGVSVSKIRETFT